MLVRFTKPIFALLATIIVASLFANSLGPLPALGPLFSPVGGFWSAAKDNNFQSQEQLNLPGPKNKVMVIRDGYGIPHIFAQNDEDAAFAVGYLHPVVGAGKIFPIALPYRTGSDGRGKH